MTDATVSRPRAERALSVRLLRCGACGESSPQKLVHRDRVRVFLLPDDPFARAFGWTDGPDLSEDSPLHHGLCLCPECHYPALAADFSQDSPGRGDEREREALRRLFVDQQAGLRGPIGLILGAAPEVLSPPRRAVRVTLAAIATARLQPECARRTIALARLHARLAWLYFDEDRLLWKKGPRTEAPSRLPPATPDERAPEWRESLGATRTVWSEIPLDEARARAQAVTAQQALCRALDSGEAEERVEEHRRLALLLGLAGRLQEAAEAYGRALDLCLEVRAACQETCRDGRKQGLASGELRPPAEAARRLGRIAEEIDLESQRACGTAPRRIPRLRVPASLLGQDLEDLPRDLGLFG